MNQLAQLGERGVARHHSQNFQKLKRKTNQVIFHLIDASKFVPVLQQIPTNHTSSSVFFRSSASDFLSVLPRVFKEPPTWPDDKLISSVTATKWLCFLENDTAHRHIFVVKHREFCKAYIPFQENNLRANVCENVKKNKTHHIIQRSSGIIVWHVRPSKHTHITYRHT